LLIFRRSAGFHPTARARTALEMPSVDDGSKLIAELSSHSSKMAALLPQVQASVQARLQAVEVREKAVSSREKELAAQERSLAERERKLAAAVKENERKSDKADKKEAAAKDKEKAATGSRKLPAAPAAPPSMVDIPMEALARATAAALLKTAG
jgi:uncharacterized protein YlxW (UPF0749 family)